MHGDVEPAGLAAAAGDEQVLAALEVALRLVPADGPWLPAEPVAPIAL